MTNMHLKLTKYGILILAISFFLFLVIIYFKTTEIQKYSSIKLAEPTDQFILQQIYPTSSLNIFEKEGQKKVTVIDKVASFDDKELGKGYSGNLIEITKKSCVLKNRYCLIATESGTFIQAVSPADKPVTSTIQGGAVGGKYIGLFRFEYIDGKWQSTISNPRLIELGVDGRAPKPELINFGKNEFFFRYDSWFSCTGCESTNTTFLYSIVDNGFREIFKMESEIYGKSCINPDIEPYNCPKMKYIIALDDKNIVNDHYVLIVTKIIENYESTNLREEFVFQNGYFSKKVSTTNDGKKIEIDQLVYLSQNKATFVEKEHLAGATAEEYHNALGCEYEQQLKCLLIRYKDENGKKYAIVTIPAQKRLNLDTLKGQINATEIRMANKDELLQVTGCNFGELYPFASLFDLGLFMDKEFLSQTELFLNAGVVDKSFIIVPEVLVKLENPIMI